MEQTDICWNWPFDAEPADVVAEDVVLGYQKALDLAIHETADGPIAALPADTDENVKKGEEIHLDNSSRGGGRAGKPPARGGGGGEASEAVARGGLRRMRQGSDFLRLPGAVLRRLRRGSRLDIYSHVVCRAVTYMRLLLFRAFVDCCFVPPRVDVTVTRI